MAITPTTWNPSDKSADITLSNGDLTAKSTNNGHDCARTIFSASSGKWYWEFTIDYDSGSSGSVVGLGVAGSSLSSALGNGNDEFGYRSNGDKGNSYSFVPYGDTWTTGDIIGIALDRDNGKVWFSKNGTWQDSGDPANGTGEAYSGINDTMFGMFSLYFTDEQITANFGASAFSYTAPTGFTAGFGEESDIEIIFPTPLSVLASIQSNVQIEVVHGALDATSSMSIGEIYLGKLIECPTPFSAQSSLHGNLQIEITEALFTSNNSLQSKTEISLSNNLFTSTSSMSIDEIFRGYLISYPSPMSAQSSLQSALQIEVNQSLFTSNGSLYVRPEIQLLAGSISASGSISAIITDPFSVAILPRVYTFTLTGDADGIDDIIIPIKSFQSRLKSGDPTYLSVVIPGTNYASEINLRLNGDLVVRMGYLSSGEIVLSEIISIVDFENIIIYEGTTNKTITLDGHRTETFTTKEINLTGSSYRNITAGKLRYRCTPNLYVRPGDTVNIDNDSFKIENITYSVSPKLETFEVSE